MKLFQKNKKVFSACMTIAMIVAMIPVNALTKEASTAITNVVEESTVTHKEDCLYNEGTLGVDCTHAHDETCEYKE